MAREPVFGSDGNPLVSNRTGTDPRRAIDADAIERVAMAIWSRREERMHGTHPKPGWWEAQGEPLRERMRNYARAAIGAMR